MRGGICVVALVVCSCRFNPDGVPFEPADSATRPDGENVDGSAGPDGDVNRDAAPGVDGAIVDGRPVDAPPVDAAPADASPVDARPVDARPAPGPCPGNYASQGPGGTVYRLGNNSARWDIAEADCDDDGDGTHLVVLDNNTELALIAPMLGSGGDGWIGVTNLARTGQFLTVLGNVATFLPWIDNPPPSPNGMPKCAFLISDSRKIDDDMCNKAHRYVCECDGFEPDPDAF